MVDDTITTGVDSLLELLRGEEKVSLADAAAELKVPADTVQAWVDFLVEERIIGIEYKFTKPYIYLNKEKEKEAEEQKLPHLQEVKKEYARRAREKQIPEEQIESLWRSHIQEALSYLEPYFNEQAQRRGVQDTHECRALFEEYKHRLSAQLEGT